MPTGALTGYLDVAQVVLYAFFAFFAMLILYLRREDKREGYPLETERAGYTVVGFPDMPSPKSFLMEDGSVHTVPRPEVPFDIRAVPTAPWPGAPLHPTGNPMIDGVGPAAYANRSNKPDMSDDMLPRLAPLRLATDFFVEPRDPDPRGMAVIGADGVVAGTVVDVWVDRSEVLIRYLEVEVPAAGGARTVLLPMPLARIEPNRRHVHVKSIRAAQFADVPGRADANVVTLLEEDKISGYYGGGTLYASPLRTESVL